MSPVSQLIPNLKMQNFAEGRYYLFNRLGAGSYGAVYRGRERLPVSGEHVTRAFKVVPKTSKSTYRREITLHGSVSAHPNIVTLHDVFQSGGYCFFVMDLLDGGDLARHIYRKRSFCRNDALIKNVFLQIIDGVEASHQSGIYHRDLKPENILCDADLTRICIGDFGLATRSKQSNAFNTGSRYYMSPECIDCDDELYPYDTARSDIWALGVILLNMVTGHIAWEKATLDDERFKSFLEEEDWLLNIFPMSKGLNSILRRIFTIIPSDALSLAEIRREIRNLDTFFMTEEELNASNADVKYMWKWYSPFPASRRTSEEVCSSDSEGGGLDSWTSSESSNSLEDDSDDSDESESNIPAVGTHLLEIAEEGRLVLPRSLGVPQPASVLRPPPRTMSSDEFPIRRPATRRAQVPPPTSSSGSSADSNLLITPETHAQDPPYVVTTEPMEPLVLDGPMLCHGKDSIQRQNAVGSRMSLSVAVQSVLSTDAA
ncbi:kinase-like protein [Trametes cingulata]|nr:kinase-like protein [Trametes cingulata]